MDDGHVYTDDRLLPRRCYATLPSRAPFHEYVEIFRTIAP